MTHVPPTIRLRHTQVRPEHTPQATRSNSATATAAPSSASEALQQSLDRRW